MGCYVLLVKWLSGEIVRVMSRGDLAWFGCKSKCPSTELGSGTIGLWFRGSGMRLIRWPWKLDHVSEGPRDWVEALRPAMVWMACLYIPALGIGMYHELRWYTHKRYTGRTKKNWKSNSGCGVEKSEYWNLGDIKCSKDGDSLRRKCRGSCGETRSWVDA